MYLKIKIDFKDKSNMIIPIHNNDRSIGYFKYKYFWYHFCLMFFFYYNNYHNLVFFLNSHNKMHVSFKNKTFNYWHPLQHSQ